jgi:signal transduction histidine kinase/DNA-binding response OmpR family regulator
MINRAMASPVTRYLLIGLTVLSLASIAWSLYEVYATQQRIAAQTTLQVEAERYLSALKDVETGYRGYINVANEDFLEPYLKARQEMDQRISILQQAVTDAGFSDEIPARMIAEGKIVLKFGEAVIVARDQSFEQAQALVKGRIGKSAMDQIRKDLRLLTAWIRQYRESLNKRTSELYIPVAIGSLLALALVIGVFVYLASKAKRTSIHARFLLADIIERAPVGLALLDRHLKINQANKTFAQMVTESGTMRADQALATFAPQTESHLRQRLQSAIISRFRFKDTGAEDSFDVTIADKQRYFKADIFPVTLVAEAGTESPGVGVVLNDRTRQREAALELETARDAAEAANRAKSAFIANMSHELRTPLTAVLGYCELIEEDLIDLGQDALLADLQKINSNARHLLGLINDVLDLSKIEAQKMDVHAIEFTLSAMLEELDAATGSLIAKNNNTLALTADAPDTHLVTDDLKVKQMLLNLIGNAAKFTTDGKITVHATQIEEQGVPHTRFTVSDTGIGMSKEQLANLFQRFSQADVTTTRKYGGTGLGLALTRALSKMLGGRIDVDSVEGQGTTFTVTIPTHYEAKVVHAETGAEVTANQSTEAMTKPATPSVLVVDDDPSARELLTRHLEREGFSVTTADSGTAALEQIKTNKPLAILLDVMMPGMDGWHVLRAIHDNPDTKDIPVIMQTVLNEKNFAYTLGASGYLKKPVRRNDLADALQSLAIATPSHEVLIVDDDEDASARLTAMLTRDGWNCRWACNGVEAMQALTERSPDLVLVDLIMPEMDGYAFIREVRKNSQFDALPLVVMTAEDVQSDKVRQLSNETAGIVQKGAMPLADLVADLRRFAEQVKPN